MTLEELEEALEEALPGGFRIDTDEDGQIIVYTNLTEDDEGELVEFESEEDDVDPDMDGDSDFEQYDESDGED